MNDRQDLLDTIIKRAEPHKKPDKAIPEGADYLREYRRVIDAVGEYRELAWGTMIYACHGQSAREPMPERVIKEGILSGHFTQEQAEAARQGREEKPPCGWEHRVWLCLGIEGPERLKDEAKLYLPCPFYCGTCPQCGGGLAHDRWNEDTEFDPRSLPRDVPYFVVPAIEKAKEFAEQAQYGGAEYIDPTGATR